jgi:site-specific recombinase XerD
MITLYRRGRVYYAIGSVKGKRVYQSLRTQFKDVAAERAKDLERELWSGVRVRPLPWAEFQREFLSWIAPHIKAASYRKYEFVVHRFGEFLARRNQDAVQAVTPAAISDYIQQRQLDLHPTRKIFVGQEGIKSDLRILRRTFSYAIQAGYIQTNPVTVPRINTQPGNTQPFSEDEVARMLSDSEVQQRPWLRAVLLTFLGTGLRISDVIHLTKKAVNFSSGAITFRTRKRGVPVGIPMHPSLREALEEHLKQLSPVQAESPWLFPTATGRAPISLDAYLRRLWRRCGIANAHAHRFRDTFAVRLLAAGASLYDVAKLLGITVAVAERHYAPYVEELRERGKRFVSMLNLSPVAEHGLERKPS